MFRVRLKNGFRAMVHVSGKIRRFKIRVCLKDRVVVHLSPYDLTRGRIVYRFLDQIPVIDKPTFVPMGSTKKAKSGQTEVHNQKNRQDKRSKTNNFVSKK